MPKISRRQMINRVALTTIFTHVACTQEDCLEEIVKDPALAKGYAWLTGQDASKVLANIREHEKTVGGVKSTSRGGIPQPLTGAIRDSAGGQAPPEASTGKDAPRKATDPSARAFYLLDDLGDADIDGRVVAYEVTSTSLRQRGSVTIRPFDPNGPILELRDVALSADGRFLIVSQSGTPPQWIFIDAATLTIAGRLMAPSGVFPRRCAIAADGKLAYAIASGVQFDQTPQPLSVQILDTATRTIVGSIPLPANTVIDDWTITPDQGLLFGVGGRFLHVLDVATRTYSASVDIVTPAGSTTFVSGNVQRLVMHPSGDRLYAVVTRFPTGAPQAAVVAVIDVNSAQKLEEFPLRYPTGVIGPRIGITANGRTLLVGFQRASEVQVFDPAIGTETESITLGAAFGFATLAVA